MTYEPLTFRTPGPIAVDLEIGIGDIRIDATDGTGTTIEVRPSDPAKRSDVDAAARTRVDHTDDRLSVKGPSGWRQWTARNGGSVDVRITLPVGSAMRIQAGVATVRSTGTLGEVRCTVGAGDVAIDGAASLEVKTGAGGVTVEHAAGRANVVSGSGAVRLGSVDGPVVVKNSNGDTAVDEVTGDIRLNAANGTISVGTARKGVVAKTANGSVRLGEVGGGTAVIQSAFGDLEIGVRDGVAAWLDLHTKFGNVRNDLAASDRPEAGDEQVEVHARTSFGDISIHRSVESGAGAERS